MDFVHFILEEGLIMIPVLFILGEIIKHTDTLPNKLIPFFLLGISLVLTPMLLGGFTPDSIVQAILVVGVTVFGDQLVKQYRRED